MPTTNPPTTINTMRIKRGTRAWQKLRTQWATAITTAAAQGTPIRCRRTGQPIQPTDQWDLGHAPGWEQATTGPNTHNLHPELATPNRAAGATQNKTPPQQPSRHW